MGYRNNKSFQLKKHFAKCEIDCQIKFYKNRTVLKSLVEVYVEVDSTFFIHANLVILATPVRIISYQVVSLGHLGGFVAF